MMIYSLIQNSKLWSLVEEWIWFLRSSFVFVKPKLEGPSSGALTVIDHRTNRRYHIPIAHNAVQAIHFQAICAGDQLDFSNRIKNGLRILDPGFQNTAVMKSQITFVLVLIRKSVFVRMTDKTLASDGIKGTIHYRQHSIDDLFGQYGFEEVSHLLIWNCIPTREQRKDFRAALFDAMKAPPPVIDAIKALP